MSQSVQNKATPAESPAQRSVTHSLPWHRVFQDHLGGATLLLATALSLAFFSWGLFHRSLLTSFVETPRSLGPGGHAYNWLHYTFQIGGLLGATIAIWHLSQARRRRPLLSLRTCPMLISWSWSIVLLGPSFEYRHLPLSASLIVITAYTTSGWLEGLVKRRQIVVRDLTPKVAGIVVLSSMAIFVGVMGFLAHWRFITFHAQPYDMSWETNAVHGIVGSGIPRVSVGSGAYHAGKLLPANYFDLHAPFSYYLYAPFYALFPDGRTLLWLQALHLSLGAVGVYWIGLRWLKLRFLACVFALAYLCQSTVQGHCLHDLHANPLAIANLLLAMGLMESKRPRWALLMIFLTAVTREETALYSGCVGLFWMFSGERSKDRFRYGLITALLSGAVLLLITRVLMPAYGGHPRWAHFVLFLGNSPGIESIVKLFVMDPLATVVSLDESRIDLAVLAILPFGALALLGRRAAWFLLLPLVLLITSGHAAFFYPGINYSAPIVPAAVVMSLAGARVWLIRARRLPRHQRGPFRLRLAFFVLLCALLSNYLYGNIASKTYKIEFGGAPYRRITDDDFGGLVSVTTHLPPFGARERALWDLIDRVPQGAAISTSWSINPQLSNRDVAVIHPDMALGQPKDNEIQYVVLGRLPTMIRASEKYERQLREDASHWDIYFENQYGIIFKRKKL